MRLRPVVLALVSVLALGAPTTAEAKAYDPVSASDPARGPGHLDEPASPGVDITALRASRASGKITVTLTFKDYRRVDYSVRSVTLADPATLKGRIVQFVTGAPGKPPKIVFYKVAYDDDLIASTTRISCAGVRGDADASRDRLVLTLPTACYPQAGAQSADVSARTGHWNATTWPTRNDANGEPPDEFDGVNATWNR